MEGRIVIEGQDIKQIGVVIKLDKDRRLIFDLNSFFELENKYETIEKAMTEVQKGSMKTIRYMFYLGLLNQDESLTEDKVGRLITIDNLNNVMQGLAIAMTISAPKIEEKN